LRRLNTSAGARGQDQGANDARAYEAECFHICLARPLVVVADSK
jgi:hypothetical protein